MPMLLEISLMPLDNNETISRFIAEALEIVTSSGLPCQHGPMSACIEGDWDEVMAVAKQCFDNASKNSNHIHMDLRILWRKVRKNRL